MSDSLNVDVERETTELSDSSNLSLRPKKHIGRALALILTCLLAGALGALVVIKFVEQPAGRTTVNTAGQTVILPQGDVVSSVAQKVSPSVVSIITESSQQRLFGLANQQSAGTGIIISKDGYILTNKHVVGGSSKRISVVLSDGQTFSNVSFVGADPVNDIAFLRISGVNNLSPATLGDSSKVQVGQQVVAIGNALGQYQTTVTTGIISALGRPVTATDGSSETEQLENMFQTDAAINPGNSGGPLVNLAGEVIGINTAIAQDAQGIGFALPIDDAKGVLNSLTKTGKVTRAFIGVRYVSITPDIATQLDLPTKNGAYIGSSDSNSPVVVPGGPADKAGLRAKDIIIRINNISIDSQHTLSSSLSGFMPGDTIDVTYLRNGKEQKTSLALGSQSSN